MRVAATALLLALIGTAYAGPTTYDYMSGPIDSVQGQCAGPCGPQIGDFVTGYVTLPGRLPENGTVTVQSLTSGFGIDGATAFNAGLGNNFEPLDSFTFTTIDSGITQFSFEEEASLFGPASFDGISGSSTTDTTTIEALAPGGGWSASASAGSWTVEQTTAVPEIDPALTFVAGVVAIVLSGRRRRFAA